MQGNYTPEFVARFWARVDRSGSCWLWTWSVNTSGHGHLRVDGRNRLAHRIAWELTYGPIPAGLSVCHGCDVRRCVRPGHLYLARQAQNMADMAARGRQRSRWSTDRVIYEPAIMPARLSIDHLKEDRRPTCPQCGQPIELRGRRFCGPRCRKAARITVADRFWSKVDTSGECWIWAGARSTAGYGQITIEGRPTYAHRLSYEWAHGAIPDGLLVCHRCDTPACVHPDHLFAGTESDNRRDMVSKGRHRPARLSGEQHWTRRKPGQLARGERVGGAILTEAQVLEMRRLYDEGIVTDRLELSHIFTTHKDNVSRIVRRQSWRHLP
jgi:hypothetical protein